MTACVYGRSRLPRIPEVFGQALLDDVLRVLGLTLFERAAPAAQDVLAFQPSRAPPQSDDRAVTAPPALPGLPLQRRHSTTLQRRNAHRIQMNVPRNFRSMRTVILDHECLVASLKDVSPSTMSAVVTCRERRQKRLHETPEIRFGGLQATMKMVDWEAVRPNTHVELIGKVNQLLQKHRPVPFLPENRVTKIPAVDHVITRTGEFNSKGTCHNPLHSSHPEPRQQNAELPKRNESTVNVRRMQILELTPRPRKSQSGNILNPVSSIKKSV